MLKTGKKNVYESVVEEYRKLILLGAFQAGEKLPSVRALATERGINPNTVERAYLALEAEGLIAIVPKKGAYVRVACADGLEREGKETLRRLKDMGITKEKLQEWLTEIYGEDGV